MKVEDLPAIVKKALAKVGMAERVEEKRPSRSSYDFADSHGPGFKSSGGKQPTGFVYTAFWLTSFKKVEGKWHVTAGFLGDDGLVTRNHSVTMTIDDETGEVTEMSTIT